MAATLLQLRRLVRSRLGIPIDDTFMPDRVLDDHINVAIQTIESESRWPWTDAADQVTINADNPDIIPTTDWRATRAVMFGDDELSLVSPIDLLTWLDTNSDMPKVWAPIGGVISVRPTPGTDTNLVHYYYRQAVWLRDDEDVPSIPEQYGGAIVAKAAELLSARESSGGDATRHGAEYTSWITRMRRDVRTSTGPTRTRVRPGGWI
jgi:hypothetical protein